MEKAYEEGDLEESLYQTEAARDLEENFTYIPKEQRLYSASSTS